MLQKAVEFDGRLCDLLMDSILEVRFARLENQRQTLLREIAALSADQISWKSAPECWSVLQIVEHLVLCEEVFGRTEKGALAKPEVLLFRLIPRGLRFAMALSALKPFCRP